MVEEASEHTRLIGKYRPLLKLGEGGMAVIYLASYESDNDFRKLVVLKCLKPELTNLREMRDAFLAEARLTARMNHPNVVQVREVFEIGVTPIIAMEYLEGRPLDSVRKSSETLPVALHLHVLGEALRGLEYFHELEDEDGNRLDPVHRDLSPHNIFVTREGTVKVLDFGIAKSLALGGEQTQNGIVKGKFRYMAPEQITGEQISCRTDLFAAGIMLWEAVSRSRLYADQSEGDIMRALLDGQIPSIREAAPDLPVEVYEMVEAALIANHDERIASARELRELVQRAIGALGERPDTDALRDLMTAHFGEDFSEQRRKVGMRLKTRASTWSVPPPALGGEARPRPTESTVRVQTSDWPSRTPLAHTTLATGARRTTLPVSTVVGLALVGALGFFVLRSQQETRPEPPSGAKVEAAPDAQTAAPGSDKAAPGSDKAAPGSSEAAPSPHPSASNTPLPTEPPAKGSAPLSPALPSGDNALTSNTKPSLDQGTAPCARPSLLDDFEDGDGRLCAAEQRSGAWNCFFDGTGVLTPPPGYFVQMATLDPPRGKSQRAISLVGRGIRDWGAGVAVPFRDGKTYDLSKYQGVRLWLRSPRPVPIRVKVATLDTLSSAYGGKCEPNGDKTCDDHFSLRRMVGPNWYYLQAHFAEMTQIGFGVPAQWKPSEATELHIAVDNDEKQGLDFDLIIDDVELF